MKEPKMRIPRAKFLACVIVLLALAALAGAGVGLSKTEGPSVNSLTTTRLDSLPTLSTVPDDVARKVHRLASLFATSPALAEQTIRLPGDSLGAIGTDVYVFRANDGRPCVAVPDLIGWCQETSSMAALGIDWSLGGGDPKTASRFIALVPDGITEVDLTVDGADVPVAIRNNLAYGEFPSTGQEALISTSDTDGNTREMTISLTG